MIHHVVTTTHLQFLTLFFLQIQMQNSQAHAANHAARRMPPEEALAASHGCPPGKLLKSSCANNIPNWVFCWRSYNFMKWQ